MRVLVLSPGTLQQQLERLPALAAAAEQLNATIQVACPLAHRQGWELLPAVEKVIPFGFDDDTNLSDWANLLGTVREPDFQVCFNFASGRQVNLMLGMSHIPTRIALDGFSTTDQIQPGSGWKAQKTSSFLQPIGLKLDADAFRLSLPAAALDSVRADQPAGDGPLLLLAPGQDNNDWPADRWQRLPGTIRQRLDSLRSQHLPAGGKLNIRAAQVACSDVVLSSCPVTQLLAVYAGVPLVALGADEADLPIRQGVRCLGGAGSDLRDLSEQDVLSALGF
ncbi:MAG: lipopolysaccharide heptosyltransferase family protein [Synechococcus sp. MED-G135]|nr:MAG: lipopolysaccharide heptosyltransferase family protein [Synechococcus sp. MED-G135]